MFVSYDRICEVEAFLFVSFDTKFLFCISTPQTYIRKADFGGMNGWNSCHYRVEKRILLCGLINMEPNLLFASSPICDWLCRCVSRLPNRVTR
jgi:hypothetical protein